MEVIGLKTGVSCSRAMIEVSNVSGRWRQGCKMRWLIEAGITDVDEGCSKCRKYKTVFD